MRLTLDDDVTKSPEADPWALPALAQTGKPWAGEALSARLDGCVYEEAEHSVASRCQKRYLLTVAYKKNNLYSKRVTLERSGPSNLL